MLHPKAVGAEQLLGFRLGLQGACYDPFMFSMVARWIFPTILTIAVACASHLGAQAPPSPKNRSDTPSTQTRSNTTLATALDALPPRYREWVLSVAGLMTQSELDYFLSLRQDFRRDAFQDAFWDPRDPDPRTTKNELRERWEQSKGNSGALPYGDPRFVLYLLNGPPGGWNLPDGRPVARCLSRAQEIEIWFYGGSERTERRFAVVLQRRAPSQPYEVWRPGDRIRPVQRTRGLPTQDIRALCADDLLGYAQREIVRLNGYEELLHEVLSPPLPSPEWLASFSASAAELPDGAETFEVEAEIAFPSRNQSRTAVQVLLGVPRDAAPGRRFADQASGGEALFHDFQLIGEVIRDGDLFESFRYRFEGPTPEETRAIPIGFTRYLRSGTVTLHLLLEDVYGGRYAQVIRDLEVPSPEGLPSARPTRAQPSFPEGPALKLYPPSGDVLVGAQRFRARGLGDFDKVTFFLDGEPVLSKRTPPYSVELDLGEEPVPHRVRVVGLVSGSEVATDQIWLNQGAQRFIVRLIEPREGGIYPGAVTVRADLITPAGASLEHLELYLGDTRIATLSEPPYTHSVELPDQGAPAVVRAVARLADGSVSEDAVVVNTAAFDTRVEVRLVQVPVLVLDRDGRPIRGLDRERFRLFDAGTPRAIERFEAAADAPLSLALLIDRSISMAPLLERVAGAAQTLLEAVAASSEDRVAILSFADRLSVDSGFDAAPGQRQRALAGLVANGRTALWDSLVQALATVPREGGQNALVLFTDGQDETSRTTYEQTRAAARRAGTSLYAIGLAESFPDRASRRELGQLATENGGRAIFLEGLDSLGETYAEILAEIRARYLLAFTASGDEESAKPRELRVEVEGAEIRARGSWVP